MKNFKKLIKEAHLGNPLNEDRFKKNKDSYIRISEPNFRKDKNNPNFLSAYIKYDTGPGVGIALGKETMAGQIRRESSAEALRQMEIIGRKLEDSYDLEDLDINDLENGVVELFAVSDDFIDMDPRSELSMALLNEENEKWDKISQMEYGKPWMELSIAQKQELLSYMNRETEKQFQTDYERRRRGDYSDDREDGMTDYQRGRMDENMGEWPKELTSRYSDEYRFELEKVTPTYKDKPGRAKYRVIDIESGELKGTPVFGTPESLMAYADDLIKPQGGTQSTNLGEDINDPVLMKARAAQMKRDAIEKKDLENKSKRISADKAIDLRYELSILDREREDILMRIEDIGVEMEQTAEPEGGPIADKLGERLMAAERELRAINSKIIDIKDDLGVFDMNESDLDEGTCGYGEDGKIDPENTDKLKPASSDLNEIGIGSEYFFQVNNDEFKKEVEKSENFNDFEKRVYGIIGPDNFKMAKITDPDAMKNYYDSIRGNKPKRPVDLDEDDDFTLNINNPGAESRALDAEVNKMGYSESLQESLRKKLQERLK